LREKYKSRPKFWATFSRGKMYVLFWAKRGLGYILGDFSQTHLVAQFVRTQFDLTPEEILSEKWRPIEGWTCPNQGCQIFIPKIPFWVYPWIEKHWCIRCPFGIILRPFGILLLPFGTFCGPLVYFPSFGKLYKEKSGNPGPYQRMQNISKRT
jgi:hypothetical protein